MKILILLVGFVGASCSTLNHRADAPEKSWRLPWKKQKPKGYSFIPKSQWFQSEDTKDNFADDKVEAAAMVFLKKQLQDPKSKLSSSELRDLEKFKAPRPNSVREAALTVGLLKAQTFSQKLPDSQTSDQKESFRESDILTSSQRSRPSLHGTARLMELDLLGALQKNKHLNSYEVSRLVLSALPANERSDYEERVADLVKDRVTKWKNLADSYDTNNQPQEGSLSLGGKSVGRQDSVQKIDGGTSEYAGGSKSLSDLDESQVEKLRQKAAESYQRAMPIRDKSARLRHLNKAKKYLEYAINRYDGNSQTSKLKNNLEIVKDAISSTQN